MHPYQSRLWDDLEMHDADLHQLQSLFQHRQHYCLAKHLSMYCKPLGLAHARANRGCLRYDGLQNCQIMPLTGAILQMPAHHMVCDMIT